MFELFRMQLGQMTGGGMKWLGAVLLSAPVLLTLGVLSTGVFDEIEEELQSESAEMKIAAGVFPATARRVEWAGKNLEFGDGAIVLSEEGLRVLGEPVDPKYVTIINRGRMFIRGGQLWFDDTKRERRRTRIHRVRRQDGVTAKDFEVAFSVETLSGAYLFLIYPQVICLLLALLYGTSLLGHELGGRTLTYLFTRPLPRWKFVLGKYMGILAGLIVPTLLSLFASWLLLGAPGGASMCLALMATTGLGLLAYNAVFVMFGFLIPRRAMVVALLYGVVFELVLSFVPALVNQITITYYLRSLFVGLLDLPVPSVAARMVGSASPLGALIALFVITAVGLAGSCVLAARREYVMKEEA